MRLNFFMDFERDLNYIGKELNQIIGFIGEEEVKNHFADTTLPVIIPLCNPKVFLFKIKKICYKNWKRKNITWKRRGRRRKNGISRK